MVVRDNEAVADLSNKLKAAKKRTENFAYEREGGSLLAAVSTRTEQDGWKHHSRSRYDRPLQRWSDGGPEICGT